MQIIDYSEAATGEKYIAEFHILTDKGVLFRKYKLCRSAKGHFYIRWPSYMIGEEGSKEFLKYVEFPKEFKEEFERKALEALEPFIRRGDPSAKTSNG